MSGLNKNWFLPLLFALFILSCKTNKVDSSKDQSPLKYLVEFNADVQSKNMKTFWPDLHVLESKMSNKTLNEWLIKVDGELSQQTIILNQIKEHPKVIKARIATNSAITKSNIKSSKATRTKPISKQ